MKQVAYSSSLQQAGRAHVRYAPIHHQAAHLDISFLRAEVLVRQVTAAACAQTFDIETGLDTDVINLNPLGWIEVSICPDATCLV